MPIGQMRQFAALRRHGDQTVAERRALLEQHQHSVEERVQSLRENLAAITEKVAQYRELELTMKVTIQTRNA